MPKTHILCVPSYTSTTRKPLWNTRAVHKTLIYYQAIEQLTNTPHVNSIYFFPIKQIVSVQLDCSSFNAIYLLDPFHIGLTCFILYTGQERSWHRIHNIPFNILTLERSWPFWMASQLFEMEGRPGRDLLSICMVLIYRLWAILTARFNFWILFSDPKYVKYCGINIKSPTSGLPCFGF